MTEIDMKKLREMNEADHLYLCPRCGDAVPVFIRTLTEEDRFGTTVEKEVHCLKCHEYCHKYGTYIQPLEIPEGERTLELKEWTAEEALKDWLDH